MGGSNYRYRLNSLTLNDGTTLQPDKLMVLVGPNNSGKSRALKDIVAHTASELKPRGVIVSAVDVEHPGSLDELRRSYDVERHLDQNGRWVARVLEPDLSKEHQTPGSPWPEGYEAAFRQSHEQFKRWFASSFGRAMVAFLTTEFRLQLVKEGASISDPNQAGSLLQLLYKAGSSATRTVSELVSKAFGREIALDFTVPSRLQIRVGNEFARIPTDPRDALPLMQQEERLDEQGDGIRSFVGIAIALLTLRRDLLLIDEPEAFLHPPQAFRIGSIIAQHAGDRQIILSTHSADVLRGILSRTRDAQIVRIDRIGNVNYFQKLDPYRLKTIMNDPLLTSSRVLDGLFYEAAVVVEADSDARFYHAASVKRSPNLDIHFVNADNKQTVSRVVKLYRDMGIRAAGIVDIDVINDSKEMKSAFSELGFPEDTITLLIKSQDRIAKAVRELPPEERLLGLRTQFVAALAKIDEIADQPFDAPERQRVAQDDVLRQLESRLREMSAKTKAWSALKQQGQQALPPAERKEFAEIWDACVKLGLFINPVGELESMLVDYGIEPTTDKKSWILRALSLISNLEVDDTKMPWYFMKAVHEYLRLAHPSSDRS